LVCDVYRVRKPGILVCRKLSTGAEVYAERLEGVSLLCSPFASGDGRIYFAGPEKSYVVEAGLRFKVLGKSNRGGGNTGASPAVSAGRIFIRDRDTLFCIGKK
jgi:outer membrane protein assembly factor BamB